jgi:hypothetical protein
MKSAKQPMKWAWTITVADTPYLVFDCQTQHARLQVSAGSPANKIYKMSVSVYFASEGQVTKR